VTRQTNCYRLGRTYLVVGIACTTLFLGMGISSVYMAYWNVDGSFPHPNLDALVLGISWSALTAMCLWLIVAYFRERLFVNSEAITKYGCVFLKKIPVSDVLQVTWKGFPHAGKIIVRSPLTSITINLGDYTDDERSALIQCFHDNFPVGIQDGWPRFSEYRRPQTKPTPQDALRTALECALLLLGFGAISISGWLLGLGDQFLVVGVMTIVAGLWYLWRRSRYQKVPETDAEPL
jgi:hypothetical protein